MSRQLIEKAEKLEQSAKELRQQADKMETDDCGCQVVRSVAGQVARVAATGILAATTGIVLPTL